MTLPPRAGILLALAGFHLLGAPVAAAPPPLPAGLGDTAAAAPREAAAPAVSPVDVSGFWEARAGLRTRDDPTQRQTSLLESRLQLGVERAGDEAEPQAHRRSAV